MTVRELAEDRRRATELCGRLFRGWDPMFSRTVDPTRDRRMEEIIRALGSVPGGAGTVLELGSGPGTLAARILRRFPRSRVVAVDTDPVLLTVGATALERFRGRSAWLLADLREAGWARGLPFRRFDAAVSSLALHWLEADEIRAVYRAVRPLLRPGGVLVNGDVLPSIRPDSSRRPADVGSVPVRRRLRPSAFRSEWERWWRAVREEPSLRDALRQRRIRMPGRIPPRRATGPREPVPLAAHERALRDAGFRRTIVTWQDGGFRVLVGVR